MTVDLGQILLSGGRLSASQLEQARAHAGQSGMEVDQAVTALDLLTEDQVADALGKHFEIPGLSLARLPKPNSRATRLVPEKIARDKLVVPLEKAGETLILLMADPTDMQALQLVRMGSSLEVQPVVGSISTVRAALDAFYMSADRRLLENVVPFVGKLITEEAARTYRALPVDRDGNVLTVAMASADPEKTKRALEMATGLQVRPVTARWEDIERAIQRVHSAAPLKPTAPAPATPAGVPRQAAAAPAPAARSTPASSAAVSVGATQSLDELLGTAPAGAAPAATRAAAPSGGSAAPGTLGLDLGGAQQSSRSSPAPPSFGAPPPATPAVEKPGNGNLSLEGLLDDVQKPKAGNGGIKEKHLQAEAAGIPSPNLGAAGGPDGPRTALKVDRSTRELMKDLASKTWGDLDKKLAKLVPEKVARNYRVVVTGRVAKKVFIAMENPSDSFAAETVAFVTGLQVEAKAATPEQVEAGLEMLYGVDEDQMAAVYESIEGMELDDVDIRTELGELSDVEAAEAAEAAPVVRLVNVLIDNAIKARASDIHFEIYEDGMRIRYRVDGVLREIMRPPLKIRDPLVSRLKIMGKMDISERRLPQDGRLRLRRGKGAERKEIDFRISSVPTIHGEKVVLRILDRGQLKIDLTQLGMEQEPLDVFREAIHKPYGMCLVVGPSGSGKTNTLYSALADVNQPDVNIITCEDPVEFSTKGLNQVQARESIGLTFALALRAFLRQDPNVILVGEVRDFETAEIAVKAALTGHMVLSTLHTNDAPACLNRLTNMGVEPFLIATSLHVVVAQRLVRKICENCKQPDTKVQMEQLVQMGFEPEEARHVKPMKGIGCNACENAGYLGRTGLFEVLKVTDEMREMILYNGNQGDIKQLAIRQGMRTLRQSGLVKVKLGITSCDDVIRETIA